MFRLKTAGSPGATRTGTTDKDMRRPRDVAVMTWPGDAGCDVDVVVAPAAASIGVKASPPANIAGAATATRPRRGPRGQQPRGQQPRGQQPLGQQPRGQQPRGQRPSSQSRSR